MIVDCTRGCGARFDDEFRTTICPHHTFAANDGQNRFAHHPEAFLETPYDREMKEQETPMPTQFVRTLRAWEAETVRIIWECADGTRGTTKR